jgi:hypothetical protein
LPCPCFKDADLTRESTSIRFRDLNCLDSSERKLVSADAKKMWSPGFVHPVVRLRSGGVPEM